MAMSIGWKPVFQDVDTRLLQRKDVLGGALGQAQQALNTYLGDITERNTQGALLAINQANNIHALESMQPEVQAYLGGQRGPVDAAKVLQAAQQRQGTLQNEWNAFEQGQVSNQLNRMAIDGTTSLDALRGIGATAPESALGLVASAVGNEQSRLAAAEDKKYGRTKDAIELDLQVQRFGLDREKFASAEAERAYKMPTSQAYEKSYDANGNEYIDTVVKPGYGDIRANIAQPLTTKGAQRAQAFMPVINQAAQASGINPNVLAKLLESESAFNVNARSTVGAKGIAQIMPATARKPGFKVDPLPANATPEQQIKFSAEYLAALNKEFGDPVLAIAAYNAGPGKIEGILKGGSIPKETQDYVTRILGTNLKEHVSQVRAGTLGKGSSNNATNANANVPRFSLPSEAMDGARTRLSDVVAQAEGEKVIKQGTVDHRKAEYDLNEFIKKENFTGNTALSANARIYAMVKNQPYYRDADPATKKAMLQDALVYDRENAGFFSRNADFNKLSEHLKINAAARKAEQTKAYDSKILGTYHAEGQKLLAEARRRDPSVTLDTVLKAIDPNLYQKWTVAMKNSQKYK